MTVSGVSYRDQYSGNGVATQFAYTFKILDASHIKVVLTDTDGVDTDMVLESDYTVGGIKDAIGGNVYFNVAPASGEKITFIRKVDSTQELDLVNNDPFDADLIEEAFDKLTMKSQELEERIDRCAEVPVSQSADDYLSQVQTARDDAQTAEIGAVQAEIRAENWAEADEDVEVEPGKYSAKHHAAKAAAFDPDSFYDKASVDFMLADAGKNFIAGVTMAQGTLAIADSTTTKSFAVVTYTGNGTSQSIGTGISSVDFTQAGNGSGYYLDRSTNQVKNDAGTVQASGSCACNVSKVFIKNRDDTNDSRVYDGLRGVTEHIFTSLTDAETTDANGLTGFTATGFAVGNAVQVNDSTESYISYQTLYTHINWGTTGDGQLYVTASNPVTREFMTYYVGSGSDGNTIPHHLGIAPDYWDIKTINVVNPWVTYYGDAGKYLLLSAADASASSSTTWGTPTSNDVVLGTGTAVNGSSTEHIMYGFANSDYKKLVTYVGTGTSNEVEVGFKPARVLCKSTSNTALWAFADNQRNAFDSYLYMDSTSAEGASGFGATIGDTSVTFTTTWAQNNASGYSYIMIVEADTNANGGDTYFELPTDDTTIAITDAVLNYTDGRGSSGYNVSSEEITSGNISFSGASDGINYVYKEKDGSYVVSTIELTFDGSGTFTFNAESGYIENSGTPIPTPYSAIAKVFVVSETPQRIEEWFKPESIMAGTQFQGDVKGGGLLSVATMFHAEERYPINGSVGLSAGINRRALNSSIVENIDGAYLENTFVYIPAGTYYSEFWADVYMIDSVSTSLYSVTDSETLVVGQTQFASSTYAGSVTCIGSGVFTVDQGTTIELRQKVQTSKASNGGGNGYGQSDTYEVYSGLKLWRVK